MSKGNQGRKIEEQHEQRHQEEMKSLQNVQSQIKLLLQEERGGKIIHKQRHRRRNLRQTVYRKYIKPRA